MNFTKKFFAYPIGLFFYFYSFEVTNAQIIPDETLPNKSVVTPNLSTLTIDGGTTRGSNLFHSFKDFSVPTNLDALFNNTPDIQNIFSRVTGGNISNIDGILRANGSANLFLINPNGIVFGPNARLKLGGSFFGSTANSIKFTDGFEFSAKNHSTSPLLTISVPIGLGLDNPGKIVVQGTGHTLEDPASTAQPAKGRNPAIGLQVNPGQILALIGGDVTLEGGVLTAEQGQIELGSVENGAANFSFTPSSWSFNYEKASSFGNIELVSKALLDASSPNSKVESGSIKAQGASISLTGGSVMLNQNQGARPSGDIVINASESLKISGASVDGKIRSNLTSEAMVNGQGANLILFTPQVVVENAGISTFTFGTAQAGNINIQSQQLKLENSGVISTGTTGTGQGGTITIDASESVQVIGGFSPISPGLGSSIVSATAGFKDGGDVTISTQRLTIKNGGRVGSTVLPSVVARFYTPNANFDGKGGDVTINVKDNLEIIGTVPSEVPLIRGSKDSVDLIGTAPSVQPTVLDSATFSVADAGNLTVSTSKLVVRDGAEIRSATFASGNAGNLKINASDFVDIKRGFINSSTSKAEPNFRAASKLPENPSGFSGELTINTPKLRITDGAEITAKNEGIGNAGNLRINAGSIRLDNSGGITASTQSGQGGDISINLRDLLLLRHNSNISAEARGAGDGGNITINTPFIIAVPQENSDIIANAVRGQGGNINIKTQGIYGLEYRSQPTPFSDINASSDFGINGTVEINTPDVNPSGGLVTLPTEPVDATGLIAQSCPGGAGSTASKFVITGTGGIPRSPSDPLKSYAVWHDLPPSQVADNSMSPATEQANGEPAQIVEAQGWRQNPDGTITLTAEPSGVVPYSTLNATPSSCHPQPSLSRVPPSTNAAKRND